MYARTLYRYYSWQAATETFNYPRCLHHEPLCGLIRSARAENRLPRKVALNERQTMFRVMNVRCSQRRSSRLPFTRSLTVRISVSLPLVRCPHQSRASMTGNLRECPRDPWVANQVLRRASTAAAPSSFVSTVYFDGPKNDGPITRQRKAADFDA